MPRILFVKTSSMGDIIHQMPVIADILQHVPQAQIDWVVEESFVEIARLHPAVNRIIPVAMRRWKKNLSARKTWQEFAAFRRNLRLQSYDVVLDTQGLLKSAVISRMARGPSHGQDQKTAREGAAAALYDHPHFISRRLHAIVRNRLLAAETLAYPLPLGLPDYGIVAPTLADLPELPQRYVVCVHGTARDSKLWPLESWIALSRYLSSHGIAIALPWGNQAEHTRAQAIAAQSSHAVVLPKMQLAALAAVLARAEAVVGLDTGLTHMAAALKIPTLAIYTDTDLWQAGVFPSKGATAITIGGKPAQPTADEAIQAFGKLF